MAIQPTQNPSLTGLAIAYSPCANGDTFINNGRTSIFVKNSDGSPHNVTVSSLVACSYGQIGGSHDVVVSVPAGAERVIGPFDMSRFNDNNNQCELAYASLTGMTIAVVSN